MIITIDVRNIARDIQNKSEQFEDLSDCWEWLSAFHPSADCNTRVLAIVISGNAHLIEDAVTGGAK